MSFIDPSAAPDAQTRDVSLRRLRRSKRHPREARAQRVAFEHDALVRLVSEDRVGMIEALVRAATFAAVERGKRDGLGRHQPVAGVRTTLSGSYCGLSLSRRSVRRGRACACGGSCCRRPQGHRPVRNAPTFVHMRSLSSPSMWAGAGAARAPRALTSRIVSMSAAPVPLRPERWSRLPGKTRGGFACTPTEHHRFRKRITRKAVRAIGAADDLAGGVKAGHARSHLDVDFDAAHLIMRDR